MAARADHDQPPGDTGVMVIVELLVFISSDYTFRAPPRPHHCWPFASDSRSKKAPLTQTPPERALDAGRRHRVEEVRFARDSPLEESGFEPLVPSGREVS